MRIALYGGSFNPLHLGHLSIAAYVLSKGLADEFSFLLNPHNPHKSRAELEDPQKRLSALREIVQEINSHIARRGAAGGPDAAGAPDAAGGAGGAGRELLSVNDVEFYLPEPLYTFETLEYLSARHRENEYLLVIGADNAAKIERWYKWRELVAKYKVLVYPRKGFDAEQICREYGLTYLPAPLVDISSTMIRKEPNKQEFIDYYLNRDYFCKVFDNIKIMVSYKELGLVNTREMFAKAVKGGYAIPAFNFNNMEQMQAIIQACVETKSPVILQVSAGARKYANQTILRYMAQGAVEYAKELGCNIPIVLHLDHGDSFELCKSCIEMGFSSVMIDGSHLSYEDNVALTKKVVDYAHQYDVTVEGELGVLAGVEDDVKAEHHTYTRPEEVEDFVKKTGVDSLAISIGTSHGAYKFKPGQKPEIRLDILHEIEKRIPGFPIVLHGSSSVPQDIVAEINKYGGALKDSIGIPENQLREAAKSAVCKINIDSDGRLAMTAAVRKVFVEHPEEFDPRKYLGPAREKLKELYIHKVLNVLGSNDKA